MNSIKKSLWFRRVIFTNYIITLLLFITGKGVASGLLLAVNLTGVYIWNNTDIGGTKK